MRAEILDITLYLRSLLTWFLGPPGPWFFFCPGWNPQGIGGGLEAWTLSLLKGASMQTLHQRHCLNQNKRVFIVLVKKSRGERAFS